MPVNRVFVATEYIDVYEDLVHAYKFDVRRQAAEPIATIMSRIKVDNAVLLCPLPTASARIRERGFDHTKLLTRQLRKITGQSFTAALKRRSNTRQLGATRTQRMRQLQDEFFVEDAAPVKGAHVLLIDDVITTGASLAAAAKTLKESGAKKVDALVFAQKL